MILLGGACFRLLVGKADAGRAGAADGVSVSPCPLLVGVGRGAQVGAGRARSRPPIGHCATRGALTPGNIISVTAVQAG